MPTLMSSFTAQSSRTTAEQANANFMETFPVATLIAVKNQMYSTIIVVYLKELYRNDPNSTLKLKAEGNALCRKLIDDNEADDTLIPMFDAQFAACGIEHRTLRGVVFDKFCENVARSASCKDIPVVEIKRHLDTFNEIGELYNNWRTECQDRQCPLHTLTETLFSQCFSKLDNHLLCRETAAKIR